MSRFLILDGYPKTDRDKFNQVEMTCAGELYQKMLIRHAPKATCEIIYTSDSEEHLSEEFISSFSGILWPGCSLTVYKEDWRVEKMLQIARKGFELGIPQYGSCWAAQVAVYVVGGVVSPHPNGREIGVARRIRLTKLGTNHPMYKNKEKVFEAFSSHDDFIESIPEEHNLILASNDWCDCQGIAIQYKNGEFWATQYHTEYNFYEMAKLFLAREKKLMDQGYFATMDELKNLSNDFVSIEKNPVKNLTWKYGLGQSILNEFERELEFSNWLMHFFPNLLK